MLLTFVAVKLNFVCHYNKIAIYQAALSEFFVGITIFVVLDFPLLKGCEITPSILVQACVDDLFVMLMTDPAILITNFTSL